MTHEPLVAVLGAAFADALDADDDFGRFGFFDDGRIDGRLPADLFTRMAAAVEAAGYRPFPVITCQCGAAAEIRTTSTGMPAFYCTTCTAWVGRVAKAGS